MSEMKAWRCKHGHVMGQVRRNGSGVRVLLLYREALTAPSPALPHFEDKMEEGDKTVEVDVMAVVEGYVADVRCSICGDVRTWVPGEEALRALIERARRLQAA